MAEAAAEAIRGRSACLLANHGMIVCAATAAQALSRAMLLETLCRQYLLALSAGTPRLLTEQEMLDAQERFKTYGPSRQSSVGHAIQVLGITQLNDKDPSMTISLTGRVALVTGASRGIGAAIARALAEAGADIAINYRDRATEAESVAAQITAIGRRSITLAADVSQSAAVNGMVKTIGDNDAPRPSRLASSRVVR